MSAGNALVTGTAGIGGAWAKLVAEAGYKVFAVDRAPSALKMLADHPNIVKIEADVGTDEGVKVIKNAVGAVPLSFVLYCAASAKNQDGKGHPMDKVSRKRFLGVKVLVVDV